MWHFLGQRGSTNKKKFELGDRKYHELRRKTIEVNGKSPP